MDNTPETRAQRVTAETLGADIETIHRHSDLRADLNMDSLDAVELVMGLEEEFGIEIADERAEALITFGDIVDLVSAPAEA